MGKSQRQAPQKFFTILAFYNPRQNTRQIAQQILRRILVQIAQQF